MIATRSTSTRFVPTNLDEVRADEPQTAEGIPRPGGILPEIRQGLLQNCYAAQ